MYTDLTLHSLKPQFYQHIVIPDMRINSGCLQSQTLQATVKSKTVHVLTKGSETRVANRSCNSR